MTKLRINLLGPPEILWENQRLNINRRTPRTLLYYLASQTNFTGRGKLISMFWQDSPPNIARKRLRETLSRIRAEIPLVNFLAVENDLVGLDYSDLSVDINEFREFQSLIGNIPFSNPSDPILPDDTQEYMISAINLWRGSEFLEGTELPNSAILEDWRYQTNLELTRARTQLLTRICDHYIAVGEYEKGLAYSRLAVEDDNLNEGLHYRVLKILVEMERFQEAHRYYLSVTKLLKDELDTNPSQQLVSIYRQIQKNIPQSSTFSGTDWRLMASIHTPFVGRELELNQLRIALEHGGGIIIAGESGLGKTRLIQEFCELHAPGRRILGCNCHPAELNLPFQPFIELLRNNVTSYEWQELSATWAESLSILLPEISWHNRSRELSSGSGILDQNRSTLLEAIRQVFLIMAQKNDLILFIDDLHWSDEATISTISYLIERTPFDEQALLVMASRPEESNSSLSEILLGNQSSMNLDVLDLERLNSKEINTLGRYVLGYPLEKELSDRLSLETGGNPFIILETLRTLKSTDSHTGFSENSRLPLAKSVYTLIKRRLKQLSPAARNVCEFAAVIGTEFDPVLISTANQQNLSITARAIEELNQRQLVEVVKKPDDELIWRFVHDKIRETIIQDTNRIRLRFLHERIAQTIEQKQDTPNLSQAPVLARHYEYAGKVNIAFGYWLQAAQWARQLYSSQEAMQILSHGEKLIFNSNEYINDELIHDMYTDWTELVFELQDAKQVRDINNRLLELGKSRNSQLLIGTALDGLSLACFVENQFENGLAFADQAISYLKQTSNTYEMMNSYTNHGIYTYMLGRLDEAIKSFETAVSFGSEVNNHSTQRGLAKAHYQLAISQSLAGWPELGLKNARISLELANKIGLHHISARAYLASSLALYYMDDYQKASQDNHQGIEIAEKLGANRMLAYLYASKAFLEYASGRVGAAYELSQKMIVIGSKKNQVDIQSLAHRIIGDIYLLLQAYPNACREYQKGIEYGGQDFWGIDNLIRFGYSQIQSGRLKTGMMNLHRGIDISHSTGFGIFKIRGLQFLSYAHMYTKEWELTRQVTDELSHQARIRNLPIVGLMARFVDGIADQHNTDPEKQIEQNQHALKFIDDVDHPYITLRILLQIVQQKKLANIDPYQEISRIDEILNYCEQQADPKIIKDSFKDYKQQVVSKVAI